MEIIKRIIPAKPRNKELYFEKGSGGGLISIGSSGGSGGTSIELISSTDEITPFTNLNALSSLRSLEEIYKAINQNNSNLDNKYLSKIDPDIAAELITFNSGIISKGLSEFTNISSIDISTDNLTSINTSTDNLTVNEPAELNKGFNTGEYGVTEDGLATLRHLTLYDGFKSPVFFSGFSGEGVRLSKKPSTQNQWVLELQDLIVNGRIDVNEVLVKKWSHIGAGYIMSHAGFVIDKVEELANVYRVYPKDPNENDFQQFSQVLCQRFDSVNFDSKRYWRLVTNVASDRSYIDLSKTDAEAGSDIPEVGDSIFAYGYRGSNNSLKGAIILSSVGDSGPYIQTLRGIDSYDVSGKTQIFIGDETYFKVDRFEVRSGNGDFYRVPVDRGIWSSATYFYYDRVSHNGSLWLCIAQPSTTTEPVNGSLVWEKQVEKGEDGVKGDKGDKGDTGAQGASAPLLYLSSTAEAMTFDSNNAPKPTTQTITFTAKLQNVTGTATFSAIPYIGTTAQSAITLGGSGNTRTLTQAQWGATVDRIVVTATLGSLSDTVTIVKLKDGATGSAGKGISSTVVTYQAGSSGTTAPTGTWLSTIPSVSAGQYLWTRTITTYTDSTTSTSYSVGKMGETGSTGATGATGKGISSTSVTYQAGSSGTTAPTGTWSSTIPTVAENQYLWSRTITTYTDSTTSTSYSVGKMGAKGIDPIVGYLTNESATLPASSTGTVSDFSGASGNFKVFEGTTDKTSSATFTKVSNTGCTAAITSAGAYSISAMTTDNATAIFRAVYNGVTIEKTLTLAKSKQGVKGDTGEDLSSGKMLYKNPTFKTGVLPNNANSTTKYNNSGGTSSFWERIAKPSDAPSDSTHIMQYRYEGTPTSPGWGGFTFSTMTRANAVFVTKIIAKIPVGRQIVNAQNAYGTGGQLIWLTSQAGTGKYETYLYKVICGASGTFSSVNFFYITGGAAEPFTVQVAFATVYDMTVYDDTYDKKITEYDTKFTQTDQAISANASAITTAQNNITGLTTRVSAAESQLTVQAGQISSKVSQTEYDQNKTQVSQQIGAIDVKANSIDLRVTNVSDGLIASGINITDKTIRLIAGGTPSGNKGKVIIEGSNFSVDANGNMKAVNGEFSGTVMSNSDAGNRVLIDASTRNIRLINNNNATILSMGFQQTGSYYSPIVDLSRIDGVSVISRGFLTPDLLEMKSWPNGGSIKSHAMLFSGGLDIRDYTNSPNSNITIDSYTYTGVLELRLARAFISEFSVKPVVVTSTMTITNETLISCNNSGTITISFPSNPIYGRCIIFKRRNTGTITLNGNGRSMYVTGIVSSRNMSATAGVSEQYIYDGTYWCYIS